MIRSATLGTVLALGIVSQAAADPCWRANATASRIVERSEWCARAGGTGVLRLYLRNGSGLEFSDVPRPVYDRLVTARATDTAFQRTVRGRYACTYFEGPSEGVTYGCRPSQAQRRPIG